MAQLAHDAKFDPVRLADSRMLLQANSGGGKSWALRLICEQCLPSLPVIVLDWEDEFHTLREKYDLVLAREDGDVPVDVRSAGLLARKLIEMNLSAVVALNELDVRTRRHYVKLFLESLLSAAKRKPGSRLVVIDEGQEVCPQKGDCESSAAVISLLSQGRKRGLGTAIATQRISRLNKDAAFECRNNMIGLTNFPDDQKRVVEMMGIDSVERTKLAHVAEGTFHVWGPAFSPPHIRQIVTDKPKTTHLDARSRQTASPAAPSTRIKSVLGEFADLAKKADAEIADMNSAKAEIARLKKELDAKPKPTAVTTTTKPVDPQPLIERAVAEHDRKWRIEYERMEKELTTRNVALFNRIRKAAYALQAGDVTDQSKPQRTPPEIKRPVIQEKPQSRIAVHHSPPIEANGLLPKGEREVLIVAAQNGDEGATRSELSILTGKKKTSRDTYISRLAGKGYMRVDGGTVYATEEGIAALGDFEPLPTGHDLRMYWLDRLPAGEAEILAIAMEAYPSLVDREEISERTGKAKTSRDTYISRLSCRKLIETPRGGGVKASDKLF